jgi:phosphoglycerate dehydrogenase-like enzyme
VNEVALVKALKEGWIAGAGLDVFENEPALGTQHYINQNITL